MVVLDGYKRGRMPAVLSDLERDELQDNWTLLCLGVSARRPESGSRLRAYASSHSAPVQGPAEGHRIWAARPLSS